MKTTEGVQALLGIIQKRITPIAEGILSRLHEKTEVLWINKGNLICDLSSCLYSVHRLNKDARLRSRYLGNNVVKYNLWKMS